MSSDHNLQIRKEYYENGQLMEQKCYRNDKLEGESKVWYTDGQLAEHQFYKNGKLDGKRRWLFATGIICIQTFFRDGEREGERKCWSQDGRVQSHEFYKGGHSISDFTDKKKRVFSRIQRYFLNRSIYQLNQMLISDLVKMI